MGVQLWGVGATQAMAAADPAKEWRWNVSCGTKSLKGVVRGERRRTTIPDDSAARPADLVGFAVSVVWVQDSVGTRRQASEGS